MNFIILLIHDIIFIKINCGFNIGNLLFFLFINLNMEFSVYNKRKWDEFHYENS